MFASYTCLKGYFNEKNSITFNYSNFPIEGDSLVSTSIIMGFCSRLAFDYFVKVTTSNISLLLGVFVGKIIYGVDLYLFKVEEYLNLIVLLKDRFFCK